MVDFEELYSTRLLVNYDYSVRERNLLVKAVSLHYAEGLVLVTTDGL